MAWGPSQLVVEAKSPEQARESAHQLSQFGFKAVEDKGDAYAGVLTFTYTWTRWAVTRAWLADIVGLLAAVWVFRILPHWWFGLPAAIVVWFLVGNTVHTVLGAIRGVIEHRRRPPLTEELFGKKK
jgi:hypothetical protein